MSDPFAVPPAVRENAVKITKNCTDLCLAMSIAYRDQRFATTNLGDDNVSQQTIEHHNKLVNEGIFECTRRCFKNVAKATELRVKPKATPPPVAPSKSPTTPSEVVITLGTLAIVAYGAVGIWGNKK
jgi:hypothetical protein